MNTGVVAGLFTGVQIGAAIFASGLLVDEVGVGLLSLLRYVIALLVLLPIFLMTQKVSIDNRDWLVIILLGLGQVGLMAILLNTAVSYTSAARVALVFATLPAISFSIDKLRGNSVTNWHASIGITLTFASVVVLVGFDVVTDKFSTADVVGLTAAFAATLIVAICSSWYRPYVQRYGKVNISMIAFSVSLLPLALFAYFFPAPTAVIDWSWSIWGILLALGLSSGLGYLMWFHAVSTIAATTVTGFLALSPITAVLLSLLFSLSEFTSSIFVSVLLVSLGIGFFAYPIKSRQQRRVQQ